MKTQYKFMNIAAVLVAGIVILALLANMVILGKYALATGAVLTALNTIVILAVFAIIYMSFVVYRICSGSMPKGISLKVSLTVLSVLFPLVISIGKLLSVNKNEIRRIFVHLNNSYIYSQKYSLNGEDIMLLSPHCIQKSFCNFKVTYDVSNCKRCGKCSVDRFLTLREKYGVKVFIATGGTLARKIIVENRPKAVVAIACERDLTSGIQEVVKIPVLGVYNERPSGPCFNTEVNIENVENAIKFFMGVD